MIDSDKLLVSTALILGFAGSLVAQVTENPGEIAATVMAAVLSATALIAREVFRDRRDARCNAALKADVAAAKAREEFLLKAARKLKRQIAFLKHKNRQGSPVEKEGDTPESEGKNDE